MAKVYGLHAVELRPGKTAEAFERFVSEEYLPGLAPALAELPGVAVRLLRCDRGVAAGSYLFMFEFDSVETRDRYFPGFETPGPDLQRFIEVLHPLTSKWDSFSTRTKNDYVAIAP